YPDQLRRVRFFDEKTNNNLIFLSNNFILSPEAIAQLYKCRWRIELFFNWIKQHLKIKSFYGTSENAVKTQIWIAVSVYVLVAIIKKRMNLDMPLYTFLQILSLTIFEKTPLYQLLTESNYTTHEGFGSKQLNLFEL
ncbi:MAG: transposase, partial [Acidobacteria bacterium]|nr:transposase [Acidobacteriota bacterium]MCG2816883.1 transposase [Candidatus Aminicenantes bacterium]